MSEIVFAIISSGVVIHHPMILSARQRGSMQGNPAASESTLVLGVTWCVSAVRLIIPAVEKPSFMVKVFY